MAQVSTYLNFPGNAFEAFTFYKGVFGTEFMGVMRMSDVPPMPDMPPVDDANKDLIVNIAMPILADHLLMASDVLEKDGAALIAGNNVYISLHPDTRAEADRLFNELSAGGVVEMPMADQFWGDYFGAFADKFGILWMINTSAKE